LKDREKTDKRIILPENIFIYLKMTQTTENIKSTKCGAFFDIDHTVISKNSASLYVKYMYKKGRLGIASVIKMMYYLALYKMDMLKFEELAERETKKYKGELEKYSIDLCQTWFDEVVVNYIYPEAKRLMEEHRKKGDPVVFLSSASVYLARPLAKHMGVEHYLCNRPEVDEDGVFTGELSKPFCYGKSKVLHARKFAEQWGLDLSESFFYTDSVTDLGAMESFGNPVAVNPDPLLRKQALKRGWRIIDFHDGNKKRQGT
jgi:HAD superfamily hydrolase (TIGR01490 family)